MDLPAPVSPVSTVKPSASSTSSVSTTTKLRIESERSIRAAAVAASGRRCARASRSSAASRATSRSSRGPRGTGSARGTRRARAATRSPSASAKWPWPSQWMPASRPCMTVMAMRQSSGMAIGRWVSACGATGTSRNDASCGARIGPPGRQRVCGGARRRGDDDAVGAHRVGEAAVDGDRALDHAAERAAVDHDVVQRERLLARAVGPLDDDRRAACVAARCSGRRASPPALRVISASEMSVRKPSRPWLMPIRGTSKGASCRASASIVPSPPTTIARSACLPRSRRGDGRRARDRRIVALCPRRARRDGRARPGMRRAPRAAPRWRASRAGRRGRRAGSGRAAMRRLNHSALWRITSSARPRRACVIEGASLIEWDGCWNRAPSTC